MKLSKAFLFFLAIPCSLFAMKAAEQMEFADGLYLRGLYDMAIQEYQVIARDEPKYEKLDAVLFRIGECYRQTGQTEGADRFYQRVITEYPRSPHRFKAEFRRAELYVTGGHYANAVTLLKILLDRKPPPEIAASSWYFLGYSQEKLGARQEAEQSFRQVIGQYADSAFFSHACLALADLLQGQGDKQAERRELYRKAMDKPATPRVGAEAAFQLAELSFQMLDYAESARAYEQLLTRYPDDARSHEAMLQAAWAYHNAGRYAEGLKLAEKALKDGAGADEEMWLYLKANCERQMARPEDALQTYAKILEKFPSGRNAMAASYEKALIYFRKGNFAEAMAQAKNLSATGTVEQDRCWLLAEASVELKKPDEAMAFYKQIREKFPDGERAPAASFRLGRLLQDGGRLEEASKIFRELAGRYAGNELVPQALFSSGYCRTKLGQDEEALKDWSTLAMDFPKYPQADDVLYQKASAEIRLQREKQAQDTLGDLLKQFPASKLAADAWYRLGMLQEKADDEAAAEKSLRAGLEAKAGQELQNQIQYRLAAVLQKRDKPAEAAGILNKLLQTPIASEMTPDLLEWLARYQLDQKAFPDSVRAAERLVQASTNASWKQIGWYLQGQGLEAGGKSEKAREAYKQAMDQDARTGEGAEAVLHLGQLALRDRAWPEAEKLFEKAAKLAESAELLDVRAKSYYGLGQAAIARQQWDAAARYFMSVAVLFDDPELTPECLYEAAAAFNRLGRAADRDKALKELKSRYPASAWTSKEVK